MTLGEVVWGFLVGLLLLLLLPLLIRSHLRGELARVQVGVIVGAARVELPPIIAPAARLPRLVERGIIVGAARVKALGLARRRTCVVVPATIRRPIECPIKGTGWLAASALGFTVGTSIQSHQRPLPLFLHHHHHAFILLRITRMFYLSLHT